MSEENKSTNEEFDKFLNKKEQEGGAFENEKSSTEETKSNKNKKALVDLYGDQGFKI